MKPTKWLVGEYIRDELTRMGLKQSDLAAMMGVEETLLSGVIHGKKYMTPEFALLLEDHTDLLGARDLGHTQWDALVLEAKKGILRFGKVKHRSKSRPQPHKPAPQSPAP